MSRDPPKLGNGGGWYHPTKNAVHGDLGGRLEPGPHGVTWLPSETAEVQYGMKTSNGGGYQYRSIDFALPTRNWRENALKGRRSHSPKRPFCYTPTEPVAGDSSRSLSIINQGTIPQGSGWARNSTPRIDFDSKSSGQAANWTGCDWPAANLTCRQFKSKLASNTTTMESHGAPSRGCYIMPRR